ncbi:cation transporter [Aestuariivivens sediminicola]|uniref:cation transporter n=1 Tax=Aestuariivivens sediminicola TaxID=2913560 RepID=UPI001F59C7E0|nr:cation transporter [Aestuariivivens sediminicola]
MKTTLYIQNLKDAGCEGVILKRLSELEHIKNISFKLPYSTITFEHHNKADIKVVKQMLSKIGYPPFGEKNTLGQKAKSYVRCTAGRIKTKEPAERIPQ